MRLPQPLATTALPEIPGYHECDNPHFHFWITPHGVFLLPITMNAQAFCEAIDNQPTAVLTYEAVAELLQEIGEGEN